MLGVKISQGTIVNILKDMAAKAETTIYEEIKREIENANCIGADETGIKINGERGWFFVFQTPTASFIKSSLKRDFETIEQTFSGGFPESIYVTDCLPAQLKVNAKGHQLCIAHLLRETENFIQSLKCPWSVNVQTFFYILLEEKAKLQEQQAVIPIERYEKLKEIFHNVLLKAVPIGSHSKVLAFARRLTKNLDSIFQFLLYNDVPPDNQGVSIH